MLARIRSAAVLGVDAYPVDVEVDITNGVPSFSTVGLPNGAVKEGRERVCAALANAGRGADAAAAYQRDNSTIELISLAPTVRSSWHSLRVLCTLSHTK